MLTLEFTFPWGRFYAHPWGVNPQRLREAEWPPSPWRLLRAIAATWFRLHPGQCANSELLYLLGTLGRELPAIDLPRVAFSKTVHYQPNYGATTDKSDQFYALYKRVRHENHFAAVGGPIRFHYRLISLPGSERAAAAQAFQHFLTDLGPSMQYFGRAESLSEFTVCLEDETKSPDGLAKPALTYDGQPCRRIAENCREVFCTDPNNFRPEDLWQPRNGHAVGATPHLVEDLLAVSQPVPDGACAFSYLMPEGWPQEWIVRAPVTPRRKVSAGPQPVVARYLRFSLQCRIGIPRTFVVSIGEQFRNQAISLHQQPSFGLSGHASPEGVNADHQHAFYLPQPCGSGEYLTELAVLCRYGFTQSEVEALMRVGCIRFGNGRYPVRPILLEAQRELPHTEAARVWRSLTPFVPPRFWYRGRGLDGDLKMPDAPEAQMVRCLRDAGVRAEGVVCRVQTDRQWEVCRVHVPKSGGPVKDRRVGIGLEIRLLEPIAFPLPAFGHSCHFGLGQFRAVRE